MGNGRAKVNVYGPARKLLKDIENLRSITPGPATMSRREWGRNMAQLIRDVAKSGLSQIAVPQWLPPTLARAVERERTRTRTAA